MGLIARKLLAEVGQAIVVASTAASSSTPSPLPHSAESNFTSPFNRNPDLNPILAITAAFLMSIFFIISFFSIYFQRCFTHVAGFDHDGIMMLYSGGGGGPPSSTVALPPSGLDRSFLETLPKVIFSSCSLSGIQKEKKEASAAATECTICLEEFLEQETLRLLPHCGHSFHLECINMWLYSHTACPLCRCSLLHPGGGGGNGNNGDAVAVAIAIDSQNNVAAMAANSVSAEEALQVREAGMPKNTRGKGEGEGEEEEGESSEN